MRTLHWGSWSLESQQRNIEVAVTIFAHDRDITCRTLVTFWIAAKNPEINREESRGARKAVPYPNFFQNP